MLVPITLVLAAAAAVAAQSDPRPNMGAVLLRGALDLPLEPVGRELLIPKGRCSGQITRDQYPCPLWSILVALSVTAKSYNPVKIEITENFEAVNIYGCGPVYVTLAQVCEPIVKQGAPSARATLQPVPGYIRS